MPSRLLSLTLLVVSVLPFTGLRAAEIAAQLNSLGRLPVKEITVFKDGHCFVAQEGQLPTDKEGNVSIDQLPMPVIGTFWPYSAERAKLSGVVVSQRRVAVPHTALTLSDLLAANVGAEATITEVGSNRYPASIVGFPTRSVEELERTSPPNGPKRLPETSSIVLLRTAEGTKAVDVSRIMDVTFKQAPQATASNEEFRNLLTLKLDWGKDKPSKQAKVGVLYLQKGVRWIPSYKVELDGKGQATVKMQATLLNELTDFTDADLNLVIGVPSFNLADTIDPIALQQTVTELSDYFQNNPRGRNSEFSRRMAMMSNSQAAVPQDSITVPADLGPDLPAGGKSEDLFVFQLKKISLKKGERMVVSLGEYTLPYRDVFTLDLPFAPPTEARNNLSSEQREELAKLLTNPKVTHKIRLTNKSKQPLTTAPALILNQGRVLAQGMMTYTAPGAESDLTVTTAVDVSVKKNDIESERTADALKQDSYKYFRVSLNGTINLVNRRAEPVDMEVTRQIMGTVTQASREGKIEKVNVFENSENLSNSDIPSRWQTYGQVNGLSRIAWKIKLEAGKSTELNYQWFYYSR